MADRTFKRGGEIIITLGKDSGAAKLALASALNRRGKGVLLPRKNDYLPRRLKKNSAFINVYDGGYVRDGNAFRSLPYLLEIPPGDRGFYEQQKQNNSLNDPALPFQTNDADLSNYLEVAQMVANIPLEDIFSPAKHLETYREDFQNDGYFPFFAQVSTQTKAHKITDSLLPEDDLQYKTDWTADGLKVNSDDIPYFAANFGYANDAWQFSIYLNPNEELQYVTVLTKELDYNAERFLVAPDKKMDIVLLPKVNRYQAAATTRFTQESGSINSVTWSQPYLYTRRREWAYEKNAAFYKRDIENSFAHYVRNRQPLYGQPEDYAAVYQKILWMEEMGVPGASVLSAPGFTPPPPISPTGNPIYPVGLDAGGAQNQLPYPPEHYPFAILYINGERYFAWR
jgi:hypothetical protein